MDPVNDRKQKQEEDVQLQSNEANVKLFNENPEYLILQMNAITGGQAKDTDKLMAEFLSKNVENLTPAAIDSA